MLNQLNCSQALSVLAIDVINSKGAHLRQHRLARIARVEIHPMSRKRIHDPHMTRDELLLHVQDLNLFQIKLVLEVKTNVCDG